MEGVIIPEGLREIQRALRLSDHGLIMQALRFFEFLTTSSTAEELTRDMVLQEFHVEMAGLEVMSRDEAAKLIKRVPDWKEFLNLLQVLGDVVIRSDARSIPGLPRSVLIGGKGAELEELKELVMVLIRDLGLPYVLGDSFLTENSSVHQNPDPHKEERHD